MQVSIRYHNERGLSVADYRKALVERGCRARVEPVGPLRRRRPERLALRLRQLANLLRFAHPDYRGREWLRDAKLEKAARAAPGPERWAKRIGRCGNRAALLSLRLAASWNVPAFVDT